MAFQSPLLWFRPLILATLILKLVARAHGQCYFPGGNWAQFQSPCDPDAFTSQCCPQGYACFSNHLCILTDNSNQNSGSVVGSAVRGSCTNPSWDEDACGSFCLNDPVSENSGGLVPCGNNTWCCGPAARGGTCNCDSGSGTLSLQSGKVQTIIRYDSLQTTLISFLSRQPSSSATEQSQKITPQPTITAPIPAGSPNTSSHSTTFSPLSTSSRSLTESSHNTTLKASIGTVVPVLGLAAIIAGYCLWRRKRATYVHAPRNDDLTSELSYKPRNQPPPGQHPYELQPSNPLQGGEPFVIAPDQDERRLPPAVTPSLTPRSSSASSYSRLFADRFQPRRHGPDKRAGKVAEKERLQKRYAADEL